ncbi:FAD-binding oxidoreductase [Streptomyces sp. NPDC093252]|uniref:FAD-binding oxidoreductase n=1 Tax=Streptomyces sp. NPDC093252 TaxID=3154980 RepID=UPI00341A1076
MSLNDSGPPPGTAPGTGAGPGGQPGVVLRTPADPGFRAAARTVNLDVEARPAAVVDCADPGAVASVLAATGDLPVAVRGSGWSPAGRSTLDGGLVLTLTGLRGIELDPDGTTVRVGAGVTAGELDLALAPYGRTLGLPSPGEPSVVGSVLLGGVGLTARALGYTCDALLAATVVTADGRVLEADDGGHPELMWALRGGGGGFGAVTGVTLRTWPVPVLDSLRCVYPLSGFRAVLEFLSAWGPGLAPEVTVVVMARTLPRHPAIPRRYRDRVGVVVSAVSTRPGGDALAPLGALAGALHQDRARIPPSRAHPAFPHRRFGVRTRSGWLGDLTGPAIEALVEAADGLPAGLSMVEVGLLGGAVATPPLPSAAPGRTARFLVNLMGMWPEDGHAPPVLDWLSSTDPGRRLGGGGAVPAFASGGQPVAVDLPRVRAVRDAYDPTGRFRRSGIT